MSLSVAIKKFLYRHLSLERYLGVLSWGFFAGLRLGLGKRSAAYEYPLYLQHLVRQGDVAIDIGANLGYYSRILSRLVGEGGKVYSVEPVKPILGVLEHNLRRCTNVEIVPFALGTEDKPILMVNDSACLAGYMGTGRNCVAEPELLPSESADGGELEFEAQMRRGSELFGRLQRLDFIKCDVEGYENVVIPELAPVIEKHLPIVLLETGGPARQKMIELFRGWGYAGYVLQDGKLVSVMRGPEKDIVFIPGHRHKDFLQR